MRVLDAFGFMVAGACLIVAFQCVMLADTEGAVKMGVVAAINFVAAAIPSARR